MHRLTKTCVSGTFWLSLICCRPALGNMQMLAGSLSWWWGEGWGGGAKHLPIARTAAVVLGQVWRWDLAQPAGAFLQTRGHIDVRDAHTISLWLSCAAASLSLATNSGLNVESSEDDDSSSEEEAPAGKAAITVKQFFSWL